MKCPENYGECEDYHANLPLNSQCQKDSNIGYCIIKIDKKIDKAINKNKMLTIENKILKKKKEIMLKNLEIEAHRLIDDFNKIKEKKKKMEIEIYKLKTIIKWKPTWEKHNKTAIRIMEDYDEKKGKKYAKGRYIDEYCNHPAFKVWKNDVWKFFEEYFSNNIKCFKCEIIITKKIFVPHHNDYIWDFICYIFPEHEQEVFPCCKDCHQQGITKKWKSN